MAISERRMQTATKKYNALMCRLCLDFLTIGTRDSESPEEKSQWNLRDMVSECQYQLDKFSEYGTNQWESLHALDDIDKDTDDTWEQRYYDDHIDEVNSAKEEMKALRQFINTYKKDISGMECHQGHCSMWD